MNNQSQSSDISEKLSLINWPGLVTGVLMLALPFLGAWWRAMAGTGVFKIAISPFYFSAVLVGQPITSSLVSYVLLGAKLAVWIGGIFLITGAVFSSKWWGRKLVNWGAMKVFWMVISLVLLFTVGIYLANRFLPSLISRFVGANAGVSLNLPYLIGTGEAKIQQENFSIIAPITISLKRTFWLAVTTAGLGVVTKIYNGKIEEKISPEEVEEKKEVMEETEEESEKEEEIQEESTEEQDKEKREEKFGIKKENEEKSEKEV